MHVDFSLSWHHGCLMEARPSDTACLICQSTARSGIEASLKLFLSRWSIQPQPPPTCLVDHLLARLPLAALRHSCGTNSQTQSKLSKKSPSVNPLHPASQSLYNILRQIFMNCFFAMKWYRNLCQVAVIAFELRLSGLEDEHSKPATGKDMHTKSVPQPTALQSIAAVLEASAGDRTPPTKQR